MSARSCAIRRFAAIVLGPLALAAASAPAAAQCTIPDTGCYPWRIEQNAEDTVILEILPSNTPTVATYRICLCPPAKGVALQFEFEDRKLLLGNVELGGGGTMCRDFRVLSSRRSKLLLTRMQADGKAVEGCYNTN